MDTTCLRPDEKVAILATCHLDPTKLARLLGGLEPPESGTVRYNGIVAQGMGVRLAGSPPRGRADLTGDTL